MEARFVILHHLSPGYGQRRHRPRQGHIAWKREGVTHHRLITTLSQRPHQHHHGSLWGTSRAVAAVRLVANAGDAL